MVSSGGSEPNSKTNRTAIEATAEVGVEITDEFPRQGTDEIVCATDVEITIGVGELANSLSMTILRCYKSLGVLVRLGWV